jgi:hypothetical protein
VKVAGLRDTEVRYVRADMEPVTTSIRLVDVESVLRGRPVRRVRSYAGQRHYSGLFWSATTGGHVSYESRLELDRQLLADFDQDVAWMASQPMWLSGRDGSAVRRHVPDLLMRLRNGEYLVSDVKPAKFAALPEVAAVVGTRLPCHFPGFVSSATPRLWGVAVPRRRPRSRGRSVHARLIPTTGHAELRASKRRVLMRSAA